MGEGGAEQGHHEARVGGVEQDVAAPLREQRGDRGLVGGVDGNGGEPAGPVVHGRHGGLGAGEVPVGDDHGLEERATGGDPGDGGTHPMRLPQAVHAWLTSLRSEAEAPLPREETPPRDVWSMVLA